MFNILGITCQVCHKSVHDPAFRTDQSGDILYFTNPNLSEYTNEIHYFCGASCSTKWHKEQMEARKNPTQ